MLVDSGSSTSFVNTNLARHLQGVQDLPHLSKLRVADGGELLCSSYIPNCIWYSQGQEFETEMKVLALKTYDAILGMDWLELHSTMQVDWCAKCLKFSTSAGTVCLQGHDSSSTTCFVINSLQLQSLYKQQAIMHVVRVFKRGGASYTSSANDPTGGGYIPRCIWCTRRVATTTSVRSLHSPDSRCLAGEREAIQA